MLSSEFLWILGLFALVPLFLLAAVHILQQLVIFWGKVKKKNILEMDVKTQRKYIRYLSAGFKRVK